MRNRTAEDRSAPRIFAIVFCLLLLVGCSQTPPEEALRRQVSALQSALESHDAGALGNAMASDFIGNDGIDRDAARRLATLYFMRDRNTGVTLGPLDITLQGDDRARVDCTAALTGGSARLLPDSGGLYDVRSGWRLENGEWRLTSLEWSRR